jgi:cell division septum initiation protein DivIVA
VETSGRLDKLKAELAAREAALAEVKVAEARLTVIKSEIEQRQTEAATAAKAVINDAHGHAGEIVQAAHDDAKRIKADAEASAAETIRNRHAEIDKLEAAITAKRSEHDGIVAALAELRSRIGG